MPSFSGHSQRSQTKQNLAWFGAFVWICLSHQPIINCLEPLIYRSLVLSQDCTEAPDAAAPLRFQWSHDCAASVKSRFSEEFPASRWAAALLMWLSVERFHPHSQVTFSDRQRPSVRPFSGSLYLLKQTMNWSGCFCFLKKKKVRLTT